MGGSRGNTLLKPKLFFGRVPKYIKVEAIREVGHGNTQKLVQEVNLLCGLITQRGNTVAIYCIKYNVLYIIYSYTYILPLPLPQRKCPETSGGGSANRERNSNNHCWGVK